MELRGQVVVVTGAANGIGAATARAFAARGARLVLADVAEGVHGVGAELGAAAFRVNVSDRAAVNAFAAEVERAHGGASVLVNNAGICVLGRFEEHDDAAWDRVMGVNFGGVLNGCRAFLPQLRARSRGWIVNVSSLFGLIGVPGQTAYCASKYAVRGLSEALWEELRDTNVGLSVVHPGGVRTGIVRDARVVLEGAARNEVGRIHDFFATKTVGPEVVADAIVRAVELERHRVLVCRETVALDLVRRIAPGLGNRFAVTMLERAMGLGALRGKG